MNEHSILGVDQVSVMLAGRQILNDVSFSIGAGEFTGLIGPNGAGKTTLLRVILGLQRPARGEVTILGRPRSPRSQAIGYVPQKVLLDPDMPVRARDLVAMGADGNRYGPPAALPGPGGGGPRDAARGRRGEVRRCPGRQPVRRRAAAGADRSCPDQPPRLLLLDEPLANLDLRSGQDRSSPCWPGSRASSRSPCCCQRMR